MAVRNDAAVPAVVLLLACDAQQSVLAAIRATQRDAVVYSPYGHRNAPSSAGLSGFNGELPESATGHYLLGHGYRAYNPTLRRFNQPDNWSPFGAGGLNTYAYCAGDPVNRRDPTGHMSWGSALGADGSMPPSESESGGASIWSSIAFGLAAIVVVGGVGAAAMKLKTRWMNRVQKGSGVSKHPRPPSVPTQRPSVIQFVPRRTPVANQSPAPVPSASPPKVFPSASSRSDYMAVQPEHELLLKGAIVIRDSKTFSRIASMPGNRVFAEKLLDEQLPLRDELRRAGRPSGFGRRDLDELQWHANVYPLSKTDPRLAPFLQGIQPFINNS